MSAQPQTLSGQAPDLIDRIANALPGELRADYYRELAHCRNLPESDEMLRILRAMQFLTVLIESAPGRVAVEREQLAEVLAGAIASITTMHQASVTYQQKLEARLATLPEEIARGINPEAIAAKLTESLRQQFQQTGLPAVADAVGTHATRLRAAGDELSSAVQDFADPRFGAARGVNDAVSQMKDNLSNACDHVRAEMNGLGRELYRTIAVLCLAGLIGGFFIGILYDRWIHPTVAASQTVEAAPAATAPQPDHKKRAR